MGVLTEFDKLEEVEESVGVEEAFFATPAAEEGVPEAVEETEGEEYITVGGGDVFVFQVGDEDIDAVFLAEEFFVFFAVLAQAGQDGEAELLDF